MKKIAKERSLGEQAYDIIKQSIISGDLSPGDVLPEEKVAGDLGISRTPLREALQLLAQDGLIVMEKGKRAVVASYSPSEALDYLEVRSVLEAYNIQTIEFTLDEALISDLEKNIEMQERTIKDLDYQEFNDLDLAFHLLLAERNKNKTLAEMIKQLNKGVNRAFLLLSKTLPISVKDAVEEHKSIVNALKDRDISLAKIKMEYHMQQVGKRIQIYLKEGEF
ncbi:GntR family transcriptional regulator [Aeromicrobium ponti]|uniref:DNA-binding GntR family transcriptional regulator n=1 Tax=Cytobacillus oceanisediminis TaxID=665099 RepID=A0A562JWQ3_9BACI|nr:GntR family transcriptional regulator [Cytobacillus oceanisediminis]TWH87597.1 DNA-binding GntR family transcriptional regulator [Cytobacillus oceanisediminis]